MRALAIMLVVFAHSVIIYTSWDLLTTDVEAPVLAEIKAAVALCHMPIFCFISGYLFVSKLGSGNFSKLFIDKFKRVMVPYYAVALLWMIPIRLLIHLPQYDGQGFSDIVVKGILLGQNNGHLWYLIFIFLAYITSYVLFGLLEKLRVNDRYAVICLFILSVIFAIEKAHFRNVPVFGNVMYRYAAHYAFFCFGLIARKFGLFETRVFRWMKKYRIAVFLVLIVLLYLYRSRIYTNKLLVGFWASLTAAAVLPDRKLPVMPEISKESFGIYLFHSPLIYITFTYLPNIHPLLMLLINFGCFGSLAFMMNRVLKKTPIRYLIGYWK